MHALVLGGADCRMEDVATLEALTGPWSGIVVAVNDAGADWPWTLHHWASLHPERFHVIEYGKGRWVDKRRANGHEPAGQLWGASRGAGEGVEFLKCRMPGGSSGLYAVEVARHVGATRIVLCGVPMDASVNPYHGATWRGHRDHRPTWKQLAAELDDVRSMSGWTADLLGLPDPTWLGCDTLPHKVLHPTEEIPYIVP